MTLLVAPNAPSASLSAACTRAAAGDVSVDVVVVGTGAGGAVAGTEFAKAGKRVLFLEAGGAFAQPDFQKRSTSWSTTHLYARRGTQVSRGSPTMVVPQGRVVGGSTVLNSGICFRPPKERLAEWAERTGAAHLREESLAPFVDEVWTRLGIVPTHAGIARRNNVLLQSGLQKLQGIEHGWIHRNAPTCLGCGICHLGCPSGAKASVDKAFLPEAVNHGARILVRARAEAVVVEGGRATGVEVAVVDDANEKRIGTLRVRADVVIIAGSAMGSPLLLQASGLGGAEVGKHLAVHPGFAVLGEFDEPVVMWDGVPQGYWARDPVDDRALIETANAGPSELFGLLGSVDMPGMPQRLAHFAMAGAMIRDEGEGSVELDDDSEVPFLPSFRVKLTPRDMAAFRAGGHTVVRAWFAAGAKRVMPTMGPARFFDNEDDAHAAIDTLVEPNQLLQPYGSHPQGTCRMGPQTGPYTGVVDGDARVHGVRGLYVMDGSIFPTTLGVNPQVTIMSLAMMLSRRLLGGAATR